MPRLLPALILLLFIGCSTPAATPSPEAARSIPRSVGATRTPTPALESPTPISTRIAPTPTQTRASSLDRSKQIDEIFSAMVTAETPGGTVIVTRDGQTLFEAAYGLADVKTRAPLTTKSIFHLGSVGKQFTALAIMMLAEEGKLKYDDPIGKYLPQLARFGERLTVRHLLNHTSGIPDYYDDPRLNGQLFNKSRMPTNKDALALLSESGKLQFTPGDKFVYSNTGYDMLGALVEQLSGKPYAMFMHARVFTPLNMRSTFSLPNPSRKNDPNLAHSYTREKNRIEAYDSDPMDNLVGSGSFYSTIEDMALYDRALNTDQLVKQSTLTDAFTPAILNNGKKSDYGFGWEVGTRAGARYVAHDGAWLGFNSYYARFLDARLAVVVLWNRDYDLPGDDIALRIADLYLK